MLPRGPRLVCNNSREMLVGVTIRIIHAAIVVAIVLSVSSTHLTAAELKKETIDEFDRYVSAVEERINQRYNVERFLWSDELPQQQRNALLYGEIVIEAARDKGMTEIKNGLIDDWWGAVFIPAATLHRNHGSGARLSAARNHL